jgi:hypothetical protein
MADVTAGPCKTLAEALAALQARLPRVAKASPGQVGNQKYLYADLADVSAALLPVMAGLGLSFIATPTMTLDYDRFVLDYQLLHVSGEKIGGFYPLPGSGTPQQMGSAITYARRYTLCAVTGLAPGGDDDDGQGAEAEHQARLRQPVSSQDKQRAKTEHLKAGTSRMARAQAEDPWAQDGPDPQPGAAEHQPGSSNPSQWQQLGILYGQLGITERDTRLAEMTDRVGRSIGSAKDLSYAEAEAAIRSLRDLAAAEKGGG